MDIRYVDNDAALAQLSADLRGAAWIALDTEFMREKTYYPQFCLLQLATPTLIACVDPLAVADLSPLLDVLYDPAIIKILHAARQDLEIFLLLRDALPAPVFDTQIAATILGYGDQVGYGNLVKAMLGVDLEKGHARTDWAQRPLDPEQIDYAADDVRYLGALYLAQQEKLQQLGRLEWLAEDFAALADPRTYRTEPQEAWLRIKGAGRLKGIQLAGLRGLAAWREEQAVRSNRPRRWILKDEVMLELARVLPEDGGRLARIRGLEAGTINRFGPALLEVMAAARQVPRSEWPVLEQLDRLSPEQEAVADLMMAVLRQRALEQGISPAAVATRRDLDQVLLGHADVPLLHGWRAAIAGQSLRALLRGELKVQVANGTLTLTPV